MDKRTEIQTREEVERDIVKIEEKLAAAKRFLVAAYIPNDDGTMDAYYTSWEFPVEAYTHTLKQLSHYIATERRIVDNAAAAVAPLPMAKIVEEVVAESDPVMEEAQSVD